MGIYFTRINELKIGRYIRKLPDGWSRSSDSKNSDGAGSCFEIMYVCQRNGIQSRIGNPMIGRSTLQMSNSGDLRGERNRPRCLVR